MKRSDARELLQWALPRLRLRWRGFRTVSGQVEKRIARRAAELGFDGVEAYRRRLENDPDEWRALDALCRVTISRFYRDRAVFELLAQEVLPRFARRAGECEATRVRALCLGCAGGEEAYTLAIIWHLEVAPQYPQLLFDVTALDADAAQIARALAGRYPAGALSELPEPLRRAAFEMDTGASSIRDQYRAMVRFELGDMRERLPEGEFALVLCRNLVFSYFEETLQREMLDKIEQHLCKDGVLVIGKREVLPADAPFHELRPGSRVFERNRGSG